jgi:tetratricopeptide (TPR) repeat protein
MKLLSLFSTLLILASCSSSRIDRKIDDVTWDSLADESYLRWGEQRLQENSNSKHKVVNCYQGKAKETLETYKKEFLTKKNDPYYWLHIGNCYFIQESWTKAEFFYRMTLEDSKIPTVKSIALNNLGLIHFKYEQWEKGREYLGKSMALAPKFKVPRYNMSQLYLQFGLYDNAIEVLSESAFRGHKDIDVYFSLANAYLYKGELSKSSEYFKMIPENHFRREDIAATYALYLIKMGNIKGARLIMKNRDRSDVPELTAISQKIEKLLLHKLKEESL